MVRSEALSGEEAWVDASEANVEVLDDKSGKSLGRGLVAVVLIIEVAIDRVELGLLHSDCRLSVRQSRFSSRGPSPRHSA